MSKTTSRFEAFMRKGAVAFASKETARTVLVAAMAVGCTFAYVQSTPSQTDVRPLVEHAYQAGHSLGVEAGYAVAVAEVTGRSGEPLLVQRVLDEAVSKVLTEVIQIDSAFQEGHVFGLKVGRVAASAKAAGFGSASVDVIKKLDPAFSEILIEVRRNMGSDFSLMPVSDNGGLSISPVPIVDGSIRYGDITGSSAIVREIRSIAREHGHELDCSMETGRIACSFETPTQEMTLASRS